MKSLAEVRAKMGEEYKQKFTRARVVVGLGTCGIAAGGDKVMKALQAIVAGRVLDIDVDFTSCIGMCYAEPTVEVALPGEASVIYGDVNPENVIRLIDEHVIGKKPVEDMAILQIVENGAKAYEGITLMEDYDFYKMQVRTVTSRLGRTNPESIVDYIATGGYEGLEKILSGMTQQQVIDEIKTSGLRGRGGGGFPTGMKWQFTHNSPGDKKYIVCNADEGDPGAFMDRSVLEGDPHSVLEGMIIAGYAIGADEGYIYVRAEYPLAIHRLNLAIAQAEEIGMLGENILDTGFNFKLRIKAGAGAFVCGEETALLTSIEGNRGMPRVRPPFPAVKGLWEKPTNLNNVETYANVPFIIRKGGEWYASMGTEKSKGSKVFCLTGKIKNTGLVEVPMGISVRDIIYKVGGGIQDDKKFKAVQAGGPSGGCLPEEKLDLPVDYDSLNAAGAIMGSGGLVVMDETTCMVDVARFFLNFTQAESCGKCTPCREGTKRMLETLTRICEGTGKPEDIETLERMGRVITKTALCGLGQTCANPILSTMRYFKDEYLAHINDKRCPAGACTELLTFVIDKEKCNGCGKCARSCPAGAITGEKKMPHEIDITKCIKCGACLAGCKFDAIYKA
ncbi:NADH dehydrogenase (quinone) [Desulfofarcimen acetoxidans DSM 771]|jgi:NADH-quinone oxidoreductase subunit F|uniref:NADH dehydrogenase (Quinone) n=1 Tax=Desulfofarcimen acetoxidans (strain ATCC 49208 / DSM 771 / KCTC 5769 / VKM B-1644 / 5575) TaxID=485916 RepID=C8VVT7_DESAS|nr:NADH-quinone oxidoreductase subunit NuoF [Desulfofarcimen acetoxidans]ACV64224.1 NADH dehydrogenase (quinone) [Desulfofarcimen acetoxidans DSM 771]